MKLSRIVAVTVLLVATQFLFAATSWAAPQANGQYHTVHAGETLFSIGRIYGVNPYTIAEVNNLPNPDLIHVGQALYIPAEQGYYHQPHTPQHPHQHPPIYGGYGYDGTGYYYYTNEPTYRRYSYTCGYYYNCY